MKRLILAAAALAVPLLGASAHAASINFGNYSGPILIKYGNFDVGRIYNIAPGTTVAGTNLVDALPQTDAASPFTPVVGGGFSPITGSTDTAEDTWGIALVTDIFAGTNAFAPRIYQAGNAALQGNTQLTAIFFGGHDVQVSADAAGRQTTSVAGVQFGLFAADVSPHVNGTPTPTDRGNSPISYPGITDGTLVLSFVGQAGHFLDAPDAEQQGTFDPLLVQSTNLLTPIGGGNLFLEKGAINFGGGLVVGTENDRIASIPASPGDPGADAQVQFTTRAGINGWSVTSDDPASMAILPVPTPSAAGMGLLGMGGLALGKLARRRRQSC